jgi:PIN domain nuclease of toxin-antitoxin system
MSHDYVTDTMALILRLEKRKLSQKVKTIFEAVEKGKINLMIPAMVLAEIGYLSERNKIETNLHEVQDYCQKFPTVTIEPITAEVIYRSFEIDDIPELHDRIIAGTAFLINLELITNDPMIIESKYVSTVW